MALMSVDLPAPLSPTSATTSPASTSKSTPVRASRGPNRLLTPFSARRGGAVVVAFMAGTCSSPNPLLLNPGGLACCRVGAGADGLGRPEAVRDHGALDVVLGHGDRIQDDGVDVLGTVVHLGQRQARRRSLALGQRDGEHRSGLSLRLDRLVDGHELFAYENALDTGQFGVLASRRPGLGCLLYTSPSPRD